jgi:antitoxin HicB
MEKSMKNPHIGSTLEEFLAEDGLLAEAQAAVAKRRVARQLAELMKKEKLTKDALAKRMKTSRAALDRLLDPANPSVTLATLGKAACALKRTLRVELS